MTGNVPIGQLGSQLYVRKIGGVNTTGYRSVDTTAEFTAGVLAKLVDNGDGPVVTPVTAVTDIPVGMLWTDKTWVYHNPVIAEAHVSTGNGLTVDLANANVLISSVKITLADGTTPCVYTTDYTFATSTGGYNVNGVLTMTTGNLATAATAFLVSYRYKDPNKAGIDQTMASGKVALFEGYGEIGTLIYDTSVAYTLGGLIYFTATGIPTTASANSAVTFGKITKVPTAADPELQIKVTL